MLKAHRVARYEDEGGGFKWALLDTKTGDVMFGAANHPLPDLIACWCKAKQVDGHLEVEADGRELRPYDFARLALAARPKKDRRFYAERGGLS